MSKERHMGGHMGEKHHGRASQLERASGGSVGDDDKNVKEQSYAGTGSDVEKEAEKRKRGGKVHKREPMHVEGAKGGHRLDRPGRKRGGAVGADSRPMTSAHNLTAPEGMKGGFGVAKTDSSDD